MFENCRSRATHSGSGSALYDDALRTINKRISIGPTEFEFRSRKNLLKFNGTSESRLLVYSKLNRHWAPQYYSTTH